MAKTSKVFKFFNKYNNGFRSLLRRKLPVGYINPDARNSDYFRSQKIKKLFRINVIRIINKRKNYRNTMNQLSTAIIIESILPLEIIPIIQIFLYDF